MDTVSSLVYRHAPRMLVPCGWAALAWSALALLAFVALLLAGASTDPTPDPVLGPFRWGVFASTA